jgi:hypothetical protein
MMSNWLAYTGAVLTGLVPPLVMYLIGSQKKVMGYAISRNETVINIRHPDIEKRLSVALDGKPLNGCRVLEVVLQNLGMKDIESQTVHLTFPAGANVLHAHCSSSTLAVGPKIEAVEHDSYSVNIPLMNPGDNVMVHLLMTNNDNGRVLITAKGPGLKFRPFDPATFISPVANRSLLVISAGVFAWICWACTATDRFMAKPFWDKTITFALIVLLLALPSAVLAYQGIVPLIKRALHWKRSAGAGPHSSSEISF